MTAKFDEDHAIIASFARLRVFPMIDEFASTRRLSVSADTALLILLSQRLIHQGVASEAVTAMVRDASEAAERLIEKPAPIRTHTSNIVRFGAKT